MYAITKNLVTPEEPKTKTFEEITSALRKYYKPKRLVIAERFKFMKRDQNVNESIASYAIELKNLAKTCEYDNFLEEALRDRFVCGLTDERIQLALLSKEGVIFQSAYNIAGGKQYRKFLPDGSNILKPLYDLEHNHEKIDWTEERETAFLASKEMIKNSRMLIIYRPDFDIIVAADASPYGVGAVISHIINGEERPIMFASRTLTKTEANYAQLHREALALFFAVQKFHKYIYGRSFRLVTDHKPLLGIFNREKKIPPLAPLRIQKWIHMSSLYDYNLEYKVGSKMGNADALSRLPVGSDEEEISVNFVEFCELPLTAKEVRTCTTKDLTLKKVMEYYRNGWPTKNSEPNLISYFKRKDELAIENDILLLGNRVIIPYQMRTRNEVYWPGIDSDIEQYCNSCKTCLIHQRKATQVPLASWPKTSKEWERLHIDFLEKYGHHVLIVVDAHSRWMDLYLMKRGTAAGQIIEKLRQSFTYFGIPEQIVSDKGPPFNGAEYEKFYKANNIKCTFGPPLHPCSNGTVEKQVATVKKCIVKQVFEKYKDSKFINMTQALQDFIFKYRNTPNTVTGYTPADMMLKRQPRTK
ncbi:Integrase zinc binding domain [Popillia japonica]|uniref:RNA-directed DNA polymerase n=1 Tax=Popillia japonica TaxID=7064 RepID=A0AAW1HTK9_POPJA